MVIYLVWCVLLIGGILLVAQGTKTAAAAKEHGQSRWLGVRLILLGILCFVGMYVAWVIALIGL